MSLTPSLHPLSTKNGLKLTRKRVVFGIRIGEASRPHHLTVRDRRWLHRRLDSVQFRAVRRVPEQSIAALVACHSDNMTSLMESQWNRVAVCCVVLLLCDEGGRGLIAWHCDECRDFSQLSMYYQIAKNSKFKSYLLKIRKAVPAAAMSLLLPSVLCSVACRRKRERTKTTWVGQKEKKRERSKSIDSFRVYAERYVLKKRMNHVQEQRHQKLNFRVRMFHR